MSGEDLDYSTRELWSCLEHGNSPSWTMYVQMMHPEDVDPIKFGFEPFDVMKASPKGKFPLHEVGHLIL